MKIKDFSAEKGLTKQAVYKAIQRAGFSAKQITDRNGNITSKGFSILRSLFPDPDEEQVSDEPKPENQQQSAEVDRLQAELEKQKQRIEELETSCKQWEQRYFEAIEQAKQEGQQLRILLSQEQQLRLNAEKQGFFKRLFAGKKTDEQQ